MILPDDLPADQTDAFIARWVDARGSERSNYQLFLTELCALLGLPQPDPAGEDTAANSYVFERRVDMAKPDGSVTRGYIDLYRRGSFILEAVNQRYPLATCQRQGFTALCRENWLPNSLKESKNCQNIDLVLGEQS